MIKAKSEQQDRLSLKGIINIFLYFLMFLMESNGEEDPEDMVG